jgi:hypothetical protein
MGDGRPMNGLRNSISSSKNAGSVLILFSHQPLSLLGREVAGDMRHRIGSRRIQSSRRHWVALHPREMGGGFVVVVWGHGDNFAWAG